MLCKHCNREITPDSSTEQKYIHNVFPYYFACAAYSSAIIATWLTKAEPYDLGEDSLNILFSKEELKDLI